MWSSGGAKSDETLKNLFSGSLRNVSKTLDTFSDSIDALGEINAGIEEFARRVVLFLGDLVVGLVSLEEGDDLSLALTSSLDLLLDDMSSGGFLSDGDIDGVVIAQTSL